jgi:hypothetical protein
MCINLFQEAAACRSGEDICTKAHADKYSKPQICCITLAKSIKCTFLAIWYQTRLEEISSEASLKMYFVLLYSCQSEVSQLFKSLSTLIKEDAFWMARHVFVCLFVC